VKLLLDTCTFLWIVDDRTNVPAHVVDAFASIDNAVYLSAVSAWEIGVKHAARRLKLADAPHRFVPRQRDAHHITPLPVDEESALQGSRLPMLHRDPFDRLLVGQAIVHGLTIVTPDPLIAQYAVRTLW
jgi:PIN domain nuclease of toxin-antitoxin system